MGKFAGLLILGLVPACAVLPVGEVQSEQEVFRVVPVVENLENPWALAFLPDGRMLITERPGRLLLLDGGQRREVAGLPEIAAAGQGGLLDVALHPGYAQNGWIYFAFSAGRGSALSTRVGRGRLAEDGGRPRLVDLQILYVTEPGARGGAHFGSRLAFAPDGSLLISLGERNERRRAQDLSDPNGSVLRLLDDGRIPPDNPFIGRRDARAEIYTYGHRNVQGLAVQPGTGLIWAHEHGPRGGDEVNILTAGRNYGWPRITYGREYSGGPIGPEQAPGLEAPVIHWTPSIAPSGMAFYTGEAFPAWQGNLFVGALVGRHLRRLIIEGTRVTHQEVLLQDGLGRIRDVRQGPDGRLYLLTDESRGGLYRLDPVP